MQDKNVKLKAVHPEKAPFSSPHTLRALARKIRRRRIVPLSQVTQVECGFTCLAMILNYYGRKTSIAELRARYGGGRDGISALGIVKAARNYGMRVRAISLQHSEFRHVPLPAIIHWQFNHFLIVERWSPKYVRVVDPSGGRKRLTSEEFDAGFTGIVITLEPGTSFHRKSTDTGALSLKTFLWQALRQAPGAIFQILAASACLQVFGLVLPLLTKVIVDQVLPAKMVAVMPVLGIGMLVLLFAQAIIALLRGWVLVYLRARIDIHFMLGFFEHLLSLPYSFFQQRSNGDLLNRMSSNTVIRDTLTSSFISTLLDSTMVIAYLVILLWQSPPFAFLTIGIGFLQVLLLLATYPSVRGLVSRELAAQGKAQGYMTEALNGISTIKAAGAEDRSHERWSNLFFDQLNFLVRRSYLQAVIDTLMGMLRALSPFALLWIGAQQVLNGTISVGTMLALNALAVAFLTPLSSLVTSGQQLQLIYGHIARLGDIVTAEPEQNNQKVLLPPRLTGRIQLENVGFQYAPDIPKVLHNINVTIEPGQKVAIVGRTGSGKTTLGKLLLGLYIPTEGQILYDGIPLQKMQYREVRRQFGVVMQDATIFSGSVLHNITLNDPAMPKEQVFKAAEIAAIHEDIAQMPMGYETFVAEGGSALSGGQRQRLAIARAVAHNPSILLLDEATSSLDVITEQKVAQHLQAFSCTQIIIAHRLSTVRNADVILVMDQGTIVERGSHEELLRRNGYYTRLIQQQLEKGERKSGLYRVHWQKVI